MEQLNTNLESLCGSKIVAPDKKKTGKQTLASISILQGSMELRTFQQKTMAVAHPDPVCCLQPLLFLIKTTDSAVFLNKSLASKAWVLFGRISRSEIIEKEKTRVGVIKILAKPRMVIT